MQNALQATLATRHVERATYDTATLPGLAAPCPSGERRRPFPLGIVGSRGDDGDIVPPGGKPRRHLPGILADASQLGSKVQADDEKTHVSDPVGPHRPASRRRALLGSVSVLLGQNYPYSHKQDLD